MDNQTIFFDQLVPGVKELTPYQPGKPISALQRELNIEEIVKLASNENPLGCTPKVETALSRLYPDISRYPDGGAFELREALVTHYQRTVQPNQITFGNGSNDVLELIARAFLSEGDHALYSQYAFAVYALACRAVNACATEVPSKAWGHDLEAIVEAIQPDTKVIFLANPNNPTGTWFDKAAWQQFLNRVPSQTLIVLDEAYAEYSEVADYPHGVDYLSDYPNLIVCKTFSKAYGLAGLRVGYALSTPEVADYLNRVRQPFNVNSFALTAATAALSDQSFIAKSRACNSAGLQQLQVGLTALGLSYIPSMGNFICVDMGRPAITIYQQLLQQGVIVRPVGNYGLMQHLRVSVGTQEENALFLSKLAVVLQEDNE